MSRSEEPAPVRVAGCDLGKATAKFAIGTIGPAGVVAIEKTQMVGHDGRPMDAFRRWYSDANVAGCAALGATGLHADELVAPAVSGLPEDACLQAALSTAIAPDGPLNVVRVGARGYAVLTRAADGQVQYLENDKCSSGTGETMVKIAGRFGLGIEEADRLARSASAAIPITARCSVFAKSEMTHFGNQGRPADALFRGYFESVATYVAALLARARVKGPVVVIGGGARLGALVDALGRVLGQDVIVPDGAQHLEALGATLLAAGQWAAAPPGPLPADPDALIQIRKLRFTTLEPASGSARRVERLVAAGVPDGADRAPTVLGLDLGSTGSKGVLTSLETGEAVLDVYDRTRGNPIDAAQRLIAAIVAKTEPDVRAIALTGSGREAAATVIRAVYPTFTDRILVLNEIVAHATAAIRCDEDDGESLSVVEIGGQDAKFIQIVGGQIVESDMNKACSAGTGSFLEEQAQFYGIEDIEQFTDVAEQAARPPNLGQMCTVFVATAAAEAHNQGFSIADLFAGFQYSVIHNYLNRVMGQRTFGKRIFFQGKPATGRSLAWTLAAVAGREVVVPANPGAMGAWGIGLCTIDEHGARALAAAPAFDLRASLGATVVERSEFQCRDKQCGNLCAVERTKVAVGGTHQVVLSGGACPKYEISTAARPKLPQKAPSAFDERQTLLEPYLTNHEGQRATVAVPAVGACSGVLPWLVTFLRELGFGIQVLRADRQSLSRGEERCYSYDACAPVKIAHGVLAFAEPSIQSIFFPKLLTLGDRDGGAGKTCPMEQALPEMVREALRARGSAVQVVSPQLSLDGRAISSLLLRQLLVVARQLGVCPPRVVPAARRAAAAQRRYEQGLAAIGRRTLAYGRQHGLPVVLLCGPLHVIHDRVVNAGIPRLLRDNGVLALPMDCIPIAPELPALPRVPWAEANRALRGALTARTRGDLYPLLLSSFGCGPASFAEHLFSTFMEGYPHSALESDGHGGTAGYVTRVQAFLHAVRQHDRRPSPVPPAQRGLLGPLRERPIDDERQSQLVIASVDRLSSILATVYRSFGFDAVACAPPGVEDLARGRRDCSGKECLPYQLIWSSFRRHLEEHPPNRRTVLVQISGEGMCRNCLFSTKDEMSLERLGLADSVALRHFRMEPQLGWAFLGKVWQSVLTWDILFQLTAYHRPMAGDEADRAYDQFCSELETIVERAPRPSRRGLLGVAWQQQAMLELVERASERFARMQRSASPALRTVLLSGDIYLRVDECGSDSLIRRLNSRGLSVIVEPTGALMEYMAKERVSELVGLPTGRLDNAITKGSMAALRRRSYRRARIRHPWLPMTDVNGMLAQSRKLLNRYPLGEAPVTVGSVLHHWKQGICDGVVVVSPWGCGPALISESLLRHQRDIPLLFVYGDGSPIDERRLNSFAFRLRRQPTRA